MNIRILTPEDAEKYKQIRIEALQYHPDAFAVSYEEEKDRPVEVYQERLGSNNAVTIGAFEENQLVGTVTLFREGYTKLSHKVNLVAMYVDPRNRGLGIGKSLVTSAIKKAMEMNGIEQINLTVVSSNVSAKSLYSSLGFTVFGTEKRALKMGDTYLDEDFMVLFLKD